MKHYLILKEDCPGGNGRHQTFNAIILNEEYFNRHKSDNFKELSFWTLENNKKVFILEAAEPIIKIIPEANIINNNQ